MLIQLFCFNVDWCLSILSSFSIIQLGYLTNHINVLLLFLSDIILKLRQLLNRNHLYILFDCCVVLNCIGWCIASKLLPDGYKYHMWIVEIDCPVRRPAYSPPSIAIEAQTVSYECIEAMSIRLLGVLIICSSTHEYNGCTCMIVYDAPSFGGKPPTVGPLLTNGSRMVASPYHWGYMWWIGDVRWPIHRRQ